MSFKITNCIDARCNNTDLVGLIETIVVSNGQSAFGSTGSTGATGLPGPTGPGGGGGYPLDAQFNSITSNYGYINALTGDSCIFNNAIISQISGVNSINTSSINSTYIGNFNSLMANDFNTNTIACNAINCSSAGNFNQITGNSLTSNSAAINGLLSGNNFSISCDSLSVNNTIITNNATVSTMLSVGNIQAGSINCNNLDTQQLGTPLTIGPSASSITLGDANNTLGVSVFTSNLNARSPYVYLGDPGGSSVNISGPDLVLVGQNIFIGPSVGTASISIGSAGAPVTSQNLSITSNQITLNTGGMAGSLIGSQIAFQENGTIRASAVVTGTSSWTLNTPDSFDLKTQPITLNQSLTQADTVRFAQLVSENGLYSSGIYINNDHTTAPVETPTILHTFDGITIGNTSKATGLSNFNIGNGNTGAVSTGNSNYYVGNSNYIYNNGSNNYTIGNHNFNSTNPPITVPVNNSNLIVGSNNCATTFVGNNNLIVGNNNVPTSNGSNNIIIGTGITTSQSTSNNNICIGNGVVVPATINLTPAADPNGGILCLGGGAPNTLMRSSAASGGTAVVPTTCGEFLVVVVNGVARRIALYN